MKKISIIFVCYLIIAHHALSQNYSKYYQNIDSAKYYAVINDYQRADSLYKKCFHSFKGFPDDYLDAIYNYYILTHNLNLDYVIGGFESGLIYKELKDEFKTSKIKFSRHKIKKLYNKYRIEREISIMPIIKMLIKDQSARWFTRKNEKADSLNAIYLTKLLNKNPDLFNRFKTGYIWSSMLNIIILHSHWTNIEPIFGQIRNKVEMGLINRESIYMIVERNAIYDGYLFSINSSDNSIIAKKKSNELICPDFIYYSNLGQFSTYRSAVNKTFFIPLNKSIAKNQLNLLRKYLFMPTIDLYLKTNPTILIPSVEEFCNSRP